MQVSISVTGADPTRRCDILEALARGGLSACSNAQEASVRIHDDGGIALSVGDTIVCFSPDMAPDDLVGAARLAVVLAGAEASLNQLKAEEPVGLIASIQAHDARNALVPMMITIDALLLHKDAGVAQLAGILADGCRTVTAMLRRISTLQPRAPRLVDVNAVVQGLMATLAALVGDRAQLTTRLESPLPRVWIDPSALERTLVNLVSNARDASRRGGRIVVVTSVRQAEDGSRWVMVEVEDQGIGMEEATRTRAFEPFFTTKSATGGTGLGLASVARAALKAGGKVTLDSAPDRGTRVSVWLPIAEV